MELPFIYKYQPLFLKDFEIDEELLVVIRTLISMDSLNVLFVGDTGCGKAPSYLPLSGNTMMVL